MQPSSPEGSQPRKRRRVENPVLQFVDLEAAEDEEEDEGEEDLYEDEDEDEDDCVGMYRCVLVPDETWLN
jgi:hypothetical protein